MIILSDEEEKKYRRLVLRSQFVSLFCAKSDSLDITNLDNWTIEDIADIAHDLGLTISVVAIDKGNGDIYTPHGKVGGS